MSKLALATWIAVALTMALPRPSVAEEGLTTSVSGTFTEPNGFCAVAKEARATFCAPGGANECAICGDNEFEYVYRVRAPGAGEPLPSALQISQYAVPVPTADVFSAGFVPGPGSVPPSAVTIEPGQVRWDFLSPMIAPGQTSEDLFICSSKGPEQDGVHVGCEFGFDITPADGATCLVPRAEIDCPCFDADDLAGAPFFGACRALDAWAGFYTEYYAWPLFNARVWKSYCWLQSLTGGGQVLSAVKPIEFYRCRQAIRDAAAEAGVSCLVY